MRITVVNHALGKRADIDLDNSSTLEELLVLAEVEMGDPFPPNQLASLAGGTSGAVFVADKPLSEQGLTDGATVNVMPPGAGAPTTHTPVPAAPVPPTAEDQLRRLFGSNTPATAPTTTTTTNSSSSAAAETASSDPAEQIRRLFAGGGGGGGGAPVAARQQQHPRGGGGRMQRPPLDPMDPEYQKKMYERIQEENMLANLEQAMEHTPEAFGRVEMLYVSAHVNKEPITAFVDSGAQMTIMNEATAERCGILRLLDRRAAGVAKGVGTAEILGRIHMAMVNLGGIHLPMSITVLKEQSMEFLIGLDQLKTHQMCIDLKKNVLQISDTVSLPFLSEGELPKHMRTNKNGGAEEEDEEAAAQKAITESLKDVKPNTTTTTTSATPAAAAAPRATSVVAESEDNDAPVNNPTTTTTTAASAPQPSTAPPPTSAHTPTQEAAIKEVVAATGVPTSVAINALEAVGWDANAAVGILLGD